MIMKSLISLITVLAIQLHTVSLDSGSEKKHRIICVGDSLTEGVGASSESYAYPALLEDMLNDKKKYEVYNLGRRSRTASKGGEASYWDDPYYQQALESQADTVILMLGTADKIKDKKAQ